MSGMTLAQLLARVEQQARELRELHAQLDEACAQARHLRLALALADQARLRAAEAACPDCPVFREQRQGPSERV